ncbi:hypothetical protein K488DRAFT_86151 [Vararia minispora EC-137]|uniref:Uncharacterized protein n=1 Tax=Vararia minispora EC-137 TaxID=1314806 RepID=A0ACB8QKD2_9AGAM|nr:hypothetical protein K488DRAFT_86151 [Vararia minispora EC-137]
MSLVRLPPRFHYIALAADPPLHDPLALRKILQDALAAAFGLARAGAHIDVLACAPDAPAILRVSAGDAQCVMAAVAAYAVPGRPRLSVLMDAPFLPALAVAGQAPVL